MKLSFQIIKPEFKGTVADQAESCIDQIASYLAFNHKTIIGLTVFVKTEKLVLLEQKRVIFEYLIQEKFKNNLPIAFVAEPPLSDFDFVIEVHAIDKSIPGFEIKYKGDDDFAYIVLEGGAKGTYMFVLGITKYFNHDGVIQSTDEVFSRMNTYLKYENMNMSHIYRQWNFIEGIVETKDENNQLTQNYQEFNDVRSKWYGKCDFVNGFPSATGIGTKVGGINVGFYAYKGPENKLIKSVVNPLQTEAFDYSEEVLVGDLKEANYCKTTPKFDRAKYIGIFENEMIFVSGTASIRGEDTLAIGDASQQTEITIQNMLELLKKESLEKSKIETNALGFQLIYLRVYIKRSIDYESIVKVCDHFFPNIAKAYIIADVCRDNLLVEIEGVAEAI